ncbi:MAG TPA: hypothetical protein VNN79_05265 [Actinomycetota bacterium]|nr:hypothetical protein [Actinomycetota bacterium]
MFSVPTGCVTSFSGPLSGASRQLGDGRCVDWEFVDANTGSMIEGTFVHASG